MKRLLTLLLFICACTSVYAQMSYAQIFNDSKHITLNLKEIELSIGVPSSQYFYPSLVERYNKNDSTLNLEDYRHLYYGYGFTKSYKPVERLPYADSLAVQLLDDRRMITTASSEKLIYYLEKIIEKQPFNIEFLNMISYIYEKMGDEKNSKIYSQRLNMIMQAIFSSGTGLKKETPWTILYRTDVTSIITVLGGEVSRRTYITKWCEYYKLKDKINNIKGFYFDFTLILDAPRNKKGKNKFEFNPYFNPKSKKFLNKK
ncbi:MAG: DUF4919 domain-containing protein [Bacteroidetes bacterium]|nr:DUF4919 domain-containing protein [Bacteroidota bacterium]